MVQVCLPCQFWVSRRTGGLEINSLTIFLRELVSRRTGGLEKCRRGVHREATVSRRTGGLERKRQILRFW